MSQKAKQQVPASQDGLDPRLTGKGGFKNFLYLVWRHLKLSTPTEIQFDIADFLQDPEIRRKVVEAFRGIGKSWITDAYVCWKLYCNKHIRILLVSASSEKAEQSLQFIKHLIKSIPFLEHLYPSDEQRNTVSYFDVAAASAAEAPSVRAAGITGQITGARADLIVADDVEIPRNSMTSTQRERLAEAIKEFEAILKPSGSIVYLGTPQTEHSIYNLLPNRGYTQRIWPARVPLEEEANTVYANRLGSCIAKRIQNREFGLPTEPSRFPDLELTERETSYGRTGFRLQFQLDTRLSDANRYPLRINDLIVFDCDKDTAPQKLIWGSTPDLADKELQSVGLYGDRYFLPRETVMPSIPYQGCVMFIDPAGRGKDESAYAVVKQLNGFLFVLASGGLIGGYTPENLQALTNIARDNSAKLVLIESNFGDGMFQQLLTPYLTKTYPVSIEEVRSSKQKEARIADTLEPIMNQHKLVVSRSVIRKDLSDLNMSEGYDCAHQYQLFWQLSRLTREKGSLPHDDRLDALAGAVAHFTSQMSTEADKAILLHRQRVQDLNYQTFMKSVKKQYRPSKPNWIRQR